MLRFTICVIRIAQENDLFVNIKNQTALKKSIEKTKPQSIIKKVKVR